MVSKTLLQSFHKDIESRSMKSGAGSAGLGLLGQQLQNYDMQFGQLSERMVECINAQQREANREFTPFIARKLAESYTWYVDPALDDLWMIMRLTFSRSANEEGTGMFMRNKAHMSQHVDQNRSKMFAEACEEVRIRLRDMCRQVEVRLRHLYLNL